jgi:hypothetical protein
MRRGGMLATLDQGVAELTLPRSVERKAIDVIN